MTVVLTKPGNSTRGWAGGGFNDGGEEHWEWGMCLALVSLCPSVPACASKVGREGTH